MGKHKKHARSSKRSDDKEVVDSSTISSKERIYRKRRASTDSEESNHDDDARVKYGRDEKRRRSSDKDSSHRHRSDSPHGDAKSIERGQKQRIPSDRSSYKSQQCSKADSTQSVQQEPTCPDKSKKKLVPSSSGKWQVEQDGDPKKHSQGNKNDTSPTEGDRHKTNSSGEKSRQEPEDASSKHSLRIFPLLDPKQALLVLDHPESITLKGKLRVRCICGSISINGYNIKSDGATHSVYSPESHSLLSVDSAQGYEGDIFKVKDLISLVRKDVNWRSELQNASSCRRPVIVLLQKMNDRPLDFVCSFSSYVSLFSGEMRRRNETDVIDLNSLGVRLYGPGSTVPCLKMTRDFDNIKEWLSSRLLKGSSPVIVVCGGKNVGKSTITRYLINTALNLVKTVAYLECDVGQTEFTPPACVSVNLVTKPVLGPTFTHHSSPTSCCFVGALSPADDPAFYMRCVSFVYNKFLESDADCPLIVNTMGWNQGIGLALLTDTLRLVKPDLVVQIDSKSLYKNIPLITSDFIAENMGWTTQTLSSSEELKSHSLISVNSVVDAQMETANHYKPFDLRIMSLLSYLGQSFSKSQPTNSFVSLCPHVIPWHQVAVHVTHMSIPKSQIMYALNASVVALCVVDEHEIVSSEKEGYPKFLKQTPVCCCLGFGVIRAIDPEKKLFYLVSSLQPAECKRVNCLLVGAVDVPQQLLLNQKSSSVPYVGFPKDVIGAIAVSRRKHMIRRKSHNAR